MLMAARRRGAAIKRYAAIWAAVDDLFALAEKEAQPSHAAD